MDPEASIRAGDIMSTPVVRIAPDETLVAAARRMDEEGISALVVDGDPPGIVTTTDIVRSVGAGTDPAETLVADAMTPEIETVGRDCSLREAARVMRRSGIKHLPIAGDDGVVGMVSSTDLTAYLPRYEPAG